MRRKESFAFYRWMIFNVHLHPVRRALFTFLLAGLVYGFSLQSLGQGVFFGAWMAVFDAVRLRRGGRPYRRLYERYLE